MSQIRLDPVKCYLCKRKTVQTCCIDKGSCPSSKKKVRDVLEYLARASNAELHISCGEFLCPECYKQLVEFDSSLVRVLQKQRKLVQLLEKAALNIDSDIEDECNDHMETLEELNDDHYFDDVNISDSEISQTMSEAMSKEEKMKKPKVRVSYIKDMRHRIVDKPILLNCNFCAMRFKSKTRLQKHISKAHKKFSCQLCEFSHRNEDYVLLHQNTHEGRDETTCRFCDKTFTTKISTIRHMEVHLDSKKYQCDKCGLCFSQTTVLYNHKLQHEAEEQPLRCDECGQVFKTKRTYRHHMITHRADRPRHSCEFCGKTFTEKYTLKVHKRTHTELVPQSEQILAEASILEIQPQTDPTITTMASTDMKNTCIICNQLLSSEESLKKHMEKEHDVIFKSAINQLACEVVSYDTKKPCHICGNMFSTQANLNFHLTHVHCVSLT